MGRYVLGTYVPVVVIVVVAVIVVTGLGRLPTLSTNDVRPAGIYAETSSPKKTTSNTPFLHNHAYHYHYHHYRRRRRRRRRFCYCGVVPRLRPPPPSFCIASVPNTPPPPPTKTTPSTTETTTATAGLTPLRLKGPSRSVLPPLPRCAYRDWPYASRGSIRREPSCGVCQRGSPSCVVAVATTVGLIDVAVVGCRG